MALVYLSVGLSPNWCTLCWLPLALQIFTEKCEWLQCNLRKQIYTYIHIYIYPKLAVSFYINSIVDQLFFFILYFKRNSKVLGISKDLVIDNMYYPAWNIWYESCLCARTEAKCSTGKKCTYSVLPTCSVEKESWKKVALRFKKFWCSWIALVILSGFQPDRAWKTGASQNCYWNIKYMFITFCIAHETYKGD